ncbi:MAG: molybdenum cofactor guanylyltransferase, partial [Conexivisphaera sp.]
VGTVGLLCGGLSTRMGHKKELQPFRGRPLLAVVAECLSGLGHSVHILASRADAEAARAITGGRYPILVDRTEARTPLNGLRSLLEVTPPGECAFLLGGDSPIIDPSLISDALGLCARGFAAVLPMWGGGMVDTVHAAYSPSVRGILEERLGSPGSDLSMAAFIRSIHPVAFLEAERYGLALGDADTRMEMTLLEHLYNGRGCSAGSF